MERKKRFTNNPPDPTFPLSKRRLQILEVVYEMELVRTSLLKLLLPEHGHFSLPTTLTKMHAAGLLDKLNVGLFDPDVYKVSDYGLERLQEYSSLPYRYVNTYRPRGQARILPLHAQMIADTIGNIRVGAMKHGIKMLSYGEILTKAGLSSDEPLRLPATATHTFKDRRDTKEGVLEPDGLFGFQYPDGTKSFIATEDQNEGKVRVNSLRPSSMLRKFLWYYDVYQKKTYKKVWGVDNLRVLFRFKKELDYVASIKLAEELFGKSPMFLFRYEPPYRISEQSGKFLAPLPNPDLVTEPLARAGLPPTKLYNT